MVKGKKRLNLILTVVALGLLVLLLVFNRHALSETLDTLQTLDWRVLLVLPALQIVSHFFIASTYSSVFRIYGYRVALSRTLPMVWALNFVNQILPSGGLSGLSYLMYGMRGYVPASKAALAQLARYALSYLSYAFVLVAALIFLVVGHDVNRRAVMLVVWLLGISLILFTVLTLLSASTRRVKRMIGWLSSTIDRIYSVFKKDRPGPGKQVNGALLEFYADYRQIVSARGKLLGPLILMVGSTVFENLIVIASFWIVGATINPGIILISFAIANGVGVVSVIPGDVGVHETAMIAALSAAGVPPAVAFSGTLLYRVFNKMLFLPLGFFAYSRLLKPVLPSKTLKS